MIPDIIRMNYSNWTILTDPQAVVLFYKYDHFVISLTLEASFLDTPMLSEKHRRHSIFVSWSQHKNICFGYCLGLSLLLWFLVLLSLYYPYDFLLNRFKIVDEILTNMEIKWKITFPTQH